MREEMIKELNNLEYQFLQDVKEGKIKIDTIEDLINITILEEYIKKSLIEEDELIINRLINKLKEMLGGKDEVFM